MAYDPATGLDDGYSFFDFNKPANIFMPLQVRDRTTGQLRNANEYETRIWGGFQDRERAFRADQTSRGMGGGGGAGTTANTQAGMSNWAGPQYNLTPPPPEPPPAPSFEAGTSTLSKSLEGKLRRPGTPNVGFGINLEKNPVQKPKPKSKYDL